MPSQRIKIVWGGANPPQRTQADLNLEEKILKYVRSVLDLIGNTPLLQLGRYWPEGNLYAKCEFINPISLKDRPVLQIILDAEESGRIKPGDTLIEVTSGNTGMAVAWISAIRGYRAILVMSETQSLERRRVLRLLELS